MSNLESLAAIWAVRGWLALLAFTVAVLVVAVLRRPCRRWFGAERAFQLWIVPPLALLASQLPHAPASSVALPPIVYTITSAIGTTASHAGAGANFDGRVVALSLWVAGLAIVSVFDVATQRRYGRRLHGATPMAGASASRPVLRAASAEVGPALVGAWRSRIVLPADFTERYDTIEQALILAHESAHARRGDGWWSLLAHALAAPFWFHPLAWWALSALRHDQELACDAAVLREHGALRRSYANTMLKTPSAAFALPMGCTWSPRHPLTERIAMLKQKPVSPPRRRAGSIALIVLISGVAGAAYAATAPGVAAHANPTVTPDHYTLELDVSLDGKPASQHQKLCLKPGEYADVNGTSAGAPPWHGRFAVLPVDKGQIEVRADLNGGTLDGATHPVVRTMPGRMATILVGRRAAAKNGDEQAAEHETSIKLDMTPSIGC